MANISKIKREKMLAFLEKLKEKNTDDSSIISLNEIENLLRSKKYGLIWEEHEEEVDEKIKEQIPVFNEDINKRIKHNDQPYNFILEGDNLQSLYLLNKTHRESIDVIYIDPPYNTEGSLTYDDTRVGLDDAYRHSKWLSFMSTRIKLAKELLTDEGIMFVSIDDNEGYQLKLLLDEIFDESNFMGSFAVIKAEGGGMAKWIVKGHDLLFVYCKNIKKAHPLARPKDIRGKIITIDNVEYWIQEDAIRETFGQYGNLHYEDVLEKRGQEFKDEIDEGIKNNKYILVPKDYGKTIIGKLRRVDEDYSKFYSVIKHLNAAGVSSLETMGLSDDFDYPKPVSLIKELIKGATFFSTKPVTVLDFFAGSGTTGQAVLELNKEDGKNRNFILCTNNEVSAKSKLKFMQSHGYLVGFKPSKQATDSSIEKKIYECFEDGEVGFNTFVTEHLEDYLSYGICQFVTYPRIKNVIEGYTSQVGTKEILYEKKITVSNLTKGQDFIDEIKRIKEQGTYEKYTERITNDGKLQLLGETNNHTVFEPIFSNVKYFKCDWTPRYPENSYLADTLALHIREMIELQTAKEVDGIKQVLILNKKQLLDFLNSENRMACESIWINEKIMITADEMKELKKFDFKYIPKAYFGAELKEVAE